MQSDSTHYLVIAGEPSGDQHAAAFVAAMRQRQPGVRFSGIAGIHMRAAGVEPWIPAEDLAVMGFSDVFKALPRLIRIFRCIRKRILVEQPAAVILVDYPDFNLRLARSLRKKGYKGKIVHYISPSVWAWRGDRIDVMASSLDLLMTIYPFEKQYFASTSLPVEYVGNPVAEALSRVERQPGWRTAVGIPSSLPLIGLFPGSRLPEVERNLPSMLEAVGSLEHYGIAISAADEQCEVSIAELVKRSHLPLGQKVFIVPREEAYVSLMEECRAAIAKSGTVTLELALCRCPTVVTYKLTRLNRFLAQYIFRINLPHYCIVNILAEGEVFPEFIAKPADVITLHTAIVGLVQEGERRSRCLEGCNRVATLLTTASAAKKSLLAR